MNKQSYSQQILDLEPPDDLSAFTEGGRQVYYVAHHNTKYAAAELAAKVDVTISELRSVVADVLKAFPDLEEYESSQGRSLSPLAARLRSALASLPVAELQP